VIVWSNRSSKGKAEAVVVETGQLFQINSMRVFIGTIEEQYVATQKQWMWLVDMC
jgi:hypothetical protein